MVATAVSPALASYCAAGDPAGQEFGVALQAPDRYLVTAELSFAEPYYGMLRARGSSLGPWETFTVRCLGNRQFALRASNGKWVSTEVSYTGRYYGVLRARASTIGPWEKYAYLTVDGQSSFGGRMGFWSVASGIDVSVEPITSVTDPHWSMLRASGRPYTPFLAIRL